jgi:hypothetical protein
MSNQPKFPISDEKMLELLNKYPFLKHRYYWKPVPEDVNKTDAENIENNWYKYWDGSGWEDLWKNRYLPRLFKLYDSWDEETNKRFCFTQVKEKFGDLRIYTSFSTDDRLESIASAISGWTCQYCGEEPRDEQGRRQIWTTGGWITNLCEKCAREHLIANGVPEDKVEETLEEMKTVQTKPDGYIQFSKDGDIRVTYKETEDGWYEVDEVVKLPPRG